MHTPSLFSRKSLSLAIGGMLVVVACSADPDPTPAPTEAGSTGAAATSEPTAVATSWRDIELTDATTGEMFTLASLEGNVVAVEPFAVWCTNCHIQQDNVAAVWDDLEADGVRFISLGVEPNESVERIARYRERRGHPWTFAQSPADLSRELAGLFGPQILAVPSTPLIILDETGAVVFQDFGFHGPDKLREIFAEFTS